MKEAGAKLLDAIKYLPCLRSRQAELKGYRELADITKASLHPVVSLGKLGRISQVEKVLERVNAIVGTCFVDLNSIQSQVCDEHEALLDPAGHYSNWRELISKFDGLTPVALINPNGSERDFIRQALQIEEKWGTLVIRSKSPSADLPYIQSALAAAASVDNVLAVLDFGYVRGAMETKLIEARSVVTALRFEAPQIRIAVVSSSFPKSVAAYGDTSSVLDIMERDFHAQLGGDEVALYGDHCSIYPEPYEPMISRWVPRIDYCTPETWHYARYREDVGGYVQCAKRIVSSADWDVGFAESNWGAGKIAETASTGEVPAGFAAPGNWISARVNMHIQRQLDVAYPSQIDDDPYDLDIDDIV